MKKVRTLLLFFSVAVTYGQYPVFTPPLQHAEHIAIPENVPIGYQSYYRILPPIPQVSFPLPPASLGQEAVCDLIAASSSKVSGQIHLYQASGAEGIEVSGSIQGLSPGLHGFHLHRDGKTDNDCKGAGPHFNPYNKTHGGPHDEIRHAGDFGNIIANEHGQADFQLWNTQLSLQPDSPLNAVGHAFVVHAGVDDLGKGGNEESLKTGNAGGRLACCVVQAAGY